MTPEDRLAHRQAAQVALQPLYTGKIDGIKGTKTDQAWKDLWTDEAAAPVEQSSTVAELGLQMNDWPLEADAGAFYGNRPSLTTIEPPFAMREFDGKKWIPIKAVTCHVKVAVSLRRILAAISAHYGGDLTSIQAAGMDSFDGTYADRPVRGSTTKKSMHAYGAAIDLDAAHNELGSTHWSMPAIVVEIFRAEGWRWGGTYTGRKDAMHFEACR